MDEAKKLLQEIAHKAIQPDIDKGIELSKSLVGIFKNDKTATLENVVASIGNVLMEFGAPLEVVANKNIFRMLVALAYATQQVAKLQGSEHEQVITE